MKILKPIIYLCLALFIAAVVFLIEGPKSPRINDVSMDYMFPGFDSAKIVRVEVEQLLEGSDLKKEGDVWWVAERVSPMKKDLIEKEGADSPQSSWHLADRSRVVGALGVFGGLEKGVLVSANPEKQMQYQLGQMGLTVKAFDAANNPVVDVIIGKGGPDFSSNYVKLGKDDKVYLVRRAMTGLFTPNINDWRQHLLWELDPAQITGVEIESSKGTWTASSEEFLKTIANARASGFADNVDMKTAGLETPSIIVTIKYAKDKTLKLSIGAKDKEEKYYAKVEGVNETYLLPKDFVDKIPLESPK